MKAGDEIEIEVEAIDADGRGVVTHDARSVRVPNLFPGERGRVRIEALARHSELAHARVREILIPSPARRPLPCPRHEDAPEPVRPERDPSAEAPAPEVSAPSAEPPDPAPSAEAPTSSAEAPASLGPRRNPACHGCPLMALDYPAQLEHTRARLEAELGLRLDGPIRTGPSEFGYRSSSKRVVSQRSGRLILGSRAAAKRRGDYVADMHGCLVEDPKLRAAFDGVEALANELGIEAFVPGRGGRGGRGDLRYVWAKTNGEAVLVTLISGTEDSRAPELGARLHAAGLAAGVAWSVQSEGGNAIRGRAPQLVAGVDQLRVELAGVEVEVGALGFLQANLELAAQAYADLLAGGPEQGALALDLYAGAGITTRLLRQRFAEVVACESYPESAAALGVEPRKAEELLGEWLAEGRPRPELVIANPPRAGLGEAVCAALVELGAPRLHLMSCSPETLAADLERLAPAYTLEGLRAYDMLPQTPHVELVAWLGRAAPC